MTEPSMEAEMLKIRQELPRVWFNLYQGCLEAGFDDHASLLLTQTWILSQNPHGIRPDAARGPSSDEPE